MSSSRTLNHLQQSRKAQQHRSHTTQRGDLYDSSGTRALGGKACARRAGRRCCRGARGGGGRGGGRGSGRAGGCVEGREGGRGCRALAG